MRHEPILYDSLLASFASLSGKSTSNHTYYYREPIERYESLLATDPCGVTYVELTHIVRQLTHTQRVKVEV